MTDALVEAVARTLAALQNFTDGDCAWRDKVPEATAALQAIEAAGYRVVPVEGS